MQICAESKPACGDDVGATYQVARLDTIGRANSDKGNL